MSDFKKHYENGHELSDAEFKKLVCELAVSMAPEFLKTSSNEDGAFERNVAYAAYDTADAIRVVLKDRMNAKI